MVEANPTRRWLAFRKPSLGQLVLWSANTAVILLALVAAERFIAMKRLPLAPIAPTHSPAIRPVVGEVLPEVPSYVFPDKERVILIATSTTCSPCLHSVPEWRKLEAFYSGRKDVAIVYLMPDDSATGARFLKALALDGSARFNVDATSAGLPAFPTVVVADRNRKVLFSSRGYLDDARWRSLQETIP
jgi:hypothetical protein